VKSLVHGVSGRLIKAQLPIKGRLVDRLKKE